MRYKILIKIYSNKIKIKTKSDKKEFIFAFFPTFKKLLLLFYALAFQTTLYKF
jgi:hypothetical protein